MRKPPRCCVITAFDLGNNVFTVALSEPCGHCSALIHTVHSSGIALHKDHQSSLQRVGKKGGGDCGCHGDRSLFSAFQSPLLLFSPLCHLLALSPLSIPLSLFPPSPSLSLSFSLGTDKHEDRFLCLLDTVGPSNPRAGLTLITLPVTAANHWQLISCGASISLPLSPCPG